MELRLNSFTDETASQSVDASRQTARRSASRTTCSKQGWTLIPRYWRRSKLVDNLRPSLFNLLTVGLLDITTCARSGKWDKANGQNEGVDSRDKVIQSEMSDVLFLIFPTIDSLPASGLTPRTLRLEWFFWASRFFVFSFYPITIFVSLFRCGRLNWIYVSFWVHVNIVYRIVSHS